MFDRFSTWAANKAAGAAAFTIAALLIIIWAPTILLIHDVDTWQLIINTTTTIVTFLIGFLILHAQRKGELALNVKIDALIAANPDASDRLKRIEERSEREIEQARSEEC